MLTEVRSRSHRFKRFVETNWLGKFKVNQPENSFACVRNRPPITRASPSPPSQSSSSSLSSSIARRSCEHTPKWLPGNICAPNFHHLLPRWRVARLRRQGKMPMHFNPHLVRQHANIRPKKSHSMWRVRAQTQFDHFAHAARAY